ncbi:MAG: valine--tRNA ligase [Candidatus Doudnabacteria bacterium]|nr:valine--tRNA ligase [Candidatus Doudnabacteria bacterium]
MKDIPKTYDQSQEPEIYKRWEDSGYFNPDNLSGEPFSIIMPPSNANGSVHVGHALGFTLQDIMIRYQRMLGRKTLWLPGMDHAGFETQVVFEKKLDKEGRSRFQMTREEFYQEVWDFVQEHKTATEQGIRRMGASADWSRNIFTLDPRIIKIVYETFGQMYADGLIYRGNRISNWCTKHQTGLADLETAHEERMDPLYYIKYGPITLATVRPETKFGDTGIAVNPSDPRYQKYIGQELEVDGLLGKFKIKVIADEAVDKDFGTGAVKVTPAHDATDFEIWQRHKNEIPGPKQVIDNRGKMDLPGTKYHGLKVKEARLAVVEDMQKMGLIEKIDENYKHNVTLCYKCKNVIEPLIIPQWYVAMTKEIKNGKSLRDMAVDAVKTKKVKINPERLEKVFMHWMDNIRDWPISRQIWWGIPIPVWYKNDDIKISENSPGDGWIQDSDTFDTWFSSGQWPFATLMATGPKDLETFYPTQVMETGWDILFFWVARMIMLGLYKTGKVPFEHVYLHGLIRDKDRQKMSKSKGNVIDPLGITDQYGVDALRMALIVGNLPGNDLPLSEDKIRGYRNFANKIWNASRFVYQNTDGYDAEAKLTAPDLAIIVELNQVVSNLSKQLDKYDFAHAAEDLYHYFWHTFADKIIEESKLKLAQEETKASAQKMLIEVLETSLLLLHPFMPFVTESIWQLNHTDLLMIQKWPSHE